MTPSRQGVSYALAAFLLWGMSPIYFKLMARIPALELLAHRTFWAALLLAAAIVFLGRWRVAFAVISTRRLFATLVVSALLLGVNWWIYIWSINADFILQVSLGYYINPLVNVLLGVVFLGEGLRKLQWAAVGLAAMGVVTMVVGVGIFPWISLCLAGSFGAYGLLRKVIPVDALSGVFVESAILAPLSIVFLGFLAFNGGGHFGGGDIAFDGLIMASGAVTAIPLLCFVAGARRLRLASLGFLQYLAPTCHFILAVLVYDEPFTAQHFVSFALIWTALGLYTFDMLRRERTTTL
jgi:chloramphenicol-sensitive protein RarD